MKPGLDDMGASPKCAFGRPARASARRHRPEGTGPDYHSENTGIEGPIVVDKLKGAVLSGDMLGKYSRGASQSKQPGL